MFYQRPLSVQHQVVFINSKLVLVASLLIHFNWMFGTHVVLICVADRSYYWVVLILVADRSYYWVVLIRVADRDYYWVVSIRVADRSYYWVVLIRVADRSYYWVVLIHVADRSYYCLVLIRVADRSYYWVVLIAEVYLWTQICRKMERKVTHWLDSRCKKHWWLGSINKGS